MMYNQFVRPKVLVTTLLLLASFLAVGGVFLFRNDWQDDIRLKLVQGDLETLWERLRGETRVVNDQSEGAVAGEIESLWENQERAEKEHRQKIVELINEERQNLNDQTPDVYPLLLLETHSTLEQSARRSFEKIAETKQFEHQDMTALLTRGEPFDTVGENLAAENNINPTRVVYDWYLSESHRELMLGDWEFIGVWSGWVEDLVVGDKEYQDIYLTVAHFGE